MYKKEILGNNIKEHLFSPPLSFASPRRWGGFFYTSQTLMPLRGTTDEWKIHFPGQKVYTD